MVPENGWYAHLEYDVATDEMHVFLTTASNQRRHIVHFDAAGQVTFTLMGIDQPKPEPTFKGGDTIGMIAALMDAARRMNYLPDTERILTAELAGVKGEMSYAKHIAERMLTNLLRPAASQD